MQTPKRATVRGYLAQGQRPHINFHGVRYTNAVLAGTAAFLCQQLRLYYNSQDLRTVRAFGADGVEIGSLKAQGALGEIAHDLKLRQEVLRLHEVLPALLDDGLPRHRAQVEGRERCPIHCRPLHTACRHCARTSAYKLDAQVLDAPFRCRHCRRYYTSRGDASLLQQPRP